MSEQRPKGWSGPAWVMEKLMHGAGDGDEWWVIYGMSTINPAAEYEGRRGWRVRRATLTMEE